VFTEGSTFTWEQLLSITIEEVYHWYKFRIYGDQLADESAIPPLRYRDNTVKTWKWAVSHFMPNHNMP
jgi:hypothetical protein